MLLCISSKISSENNNNKSLLLLDHHYYYHCVLRVGSTTVYHYDYAAHHLEELLPLLHCYCHY